MKDKSEVFNLREQGSMSLKNAKYEEAVFHFSLAIMMDNKNHSLYSNRSEAFLKLNLFYFALEDAKEAIRLQPDWAEGYYRKGEVEFSTCNFSDALFSFRSALMLEPKATVLDLAVKKTIAAMKQDEASDSHISWIGAAIGIIVGASIVVADQIFTDKPTIVDPISMVLLTFAFASVGYGTVRYGFHYYIKCQRIALLEPPVVFTPEKDAKKEIKEVRGNRIRYSKMQVRHKYKMNRHN